MLGRHQILHILIHSPEKSLATTSGPPAAGRDDWVGDPSSEFILGYFGPVVTGISRRLLEGTPPPRCCGNPGSGQEKPDSRRDMTQTHTHPSVVDWMPTWRRLISLWNPQPPRGVRGETTGKRDPRSGSRNPPCHPGGFSSQMLSLCQAEPLPGPSPNSPFEELLFYAQLTVPDGALS